MTDMVSNSHAQHNHSCGECGKTEKELLPLSKEFGKKPLVHLPNHESLYLCPPCNERMYANAYENIEPGKCSICGKEGHVKILGNKTSICPSCISDFQDVDVNLPKAENGSRLEQIAGDTEDAQISSSEKPYQEKIYARGINNKFMGKRYNNSIDGKLNINNLDPNDLYDRLTKYVKGHKFELLELSNAVAKHYALRELLGKDTTKDKETPFIIGPSGCGKTLSFESLAKIINVPYSRIACSEMSGPGHIGAKLKDELYKYVRDKAKGDPEEAEKGIVFFDEIDSKETRSDTHGRDVAGKDVQNQFVELLQTNELELRPPSGEEGTTYVINPRKILLALGGAYQDIYNKMENEKKDKHIGFESGANEVKKRKSEIYKKLLSPYVLTTLYGRTKPIFFEALLKEDIGEIIRDIKLKEIQVENELYYKKLGYSINVNVTPDGIMKIAEYVVKSGIGARDIKNVFGEILDTDILNMIRSNKHKKLNYTINAELVEEKLKSR